MEAEQKDFSQEEVFTHPHSHIVHECVMALVNNVLSKRAFANTRAFSGEVREDANCPREKLAVVHMVGEKELNLMYVKFERKGHLPSKKRPIRHHFKNAYTSTKEMLPFFSKYGGQPYYYKDTLSKARLSGLSFEIINLFKLLEPYCTFRVDPYIPDEFSSKEGHLTISICLSDEFTYGRDFDFIATVCIYSPDEARRLLRERPAKQESNLTGEGDV